MTGAGLLIAAAFDVALGDPPDRFHPVWWLGRLISRLEERIYRVDDGFVGGAVLAASVLTLTTLLCRAVLASARVLGRRSALLASAAIVYFCISWRTLMKEALAIRDLLTDSDLDGARERLKALAGRDARDLDGAGISRAVVESVAENASDGVIAPLFWAAAGGPELAALYRAANTLDSMVGYDDDRYGRFGTASARADDILNLVPARLTALALAAAGGLMGLDPGGALRVARRDAPAHRSPNAGWPEAAMAGLLGVALGGEARYGGRDVMHASLGDALVDTGPATITQAVRVSSLACMLAVASMAALAAVRRWSS
jgi:adenosylcobinamide-phosphate synthase